MNHPHDPHPHESHPLGRECLTTKGIDEAIQGIRHLRWPKERFFWSVLEAPGVKSPGPLHPALLEKLGEEIPVDLAGIHAVEVPTGDGRVLACAVLREELARLEGGILSLTPEEVPAFVQVDGEGVAHRLNLLVGDFEPLPIRRARMRRHLVAMAAMVLCGVLLSVGFARRAAHHREVASTAAAATRELIASSIPGATSEQLATEVKKLELAAGVRTRVGKGSDAGIALSDLLKGWPKDVPSKPQAIAVTPTSATVSVSVEGDPSKFLRAMKHAGGWAMAEPRLNAADNVTRLTLQFQASKEGVTP